MILGEINLSESDALAIAMVAVLGFVLTLLLSLLLIINRHANRSDHPLDGLDLEEEERKLGNEQKKAPPEKRASWERDPDWWKEG